MSIEQFSEVLSEYNSEKISLVESMKEALDALDGKGGNSYPELKQAARQAVEAIQETAPSFETLDDVTSLYNNDRRLILEAFKAMEKYMEPLSSQAGIDEFSLDIPEFEEVSFATLEDAEETYGDHSREYEQILEDAEEFIESIEEDEGVEEDDDSEVYGSGEDEPEENPLHDIVRKRYDYDYDKREAADSLRKIVGKLRRIEDGESIVDSIVTEKIESLRSSTPTPESMVAAVHQYNLDYAILYSVIKETGDWANRIATEFSMSKGFAIIGLQPDAKVTFASLEEAEQIYDGHYGAFNNNIGDLESFVESLEEEKANRQRAKAEAEKASYREEAKNVQSPVPNDAKKTVWTRIRRALRALWRELFH